MLETVLFDMGGTLEDIHYSPKTIELVTKRLMEMLESFGLKAECTAEEFWQKVNDGVCSYKSWSEACHLEKKPEEIWPNYYLSSFDFDKEKLAFIAEDLAGMWEVSYYHRELRPGVPEMLESLKSRGYKLGIVSNTASVYSVFDVLEGYGIRDYFEDVTLSSVTGYRKPHTGIFKIALRQMQSRAENCIYVGDTRSRDIIGAKRAGFGKAIQIKSFLSKQKDEEMASSEFDPDYIISDFSGFGELLDTIGK